jgi:hypothetical protein
MICSNVEASLPHPCPLGIHAYPISCPCMVHQDSPYITCMVFVIYMNQIRETGGRRMSVSIIILYLRNSTPIHQPCQCSLYWTSKLLSNGLSPLTSPYPPFLYLLAFDLFSTLPVETIVTLL